ncbi:hypothetical protein D046_3957B, partial [Vibrio parahaemolyticus V-223/04]
TKLNSCCLKITLLHPFCVKSSVTIT